MEKRKAIFVTVLFVVMLAAIDSFLFIISTVGFAVLTGTLVVCGGLRLACDFYHWMRQTDSADSQQLIAPDINGVTLCANQEAGREAKTHDKDGTIMKVLNEDV